MKCISVLIWTCFITGNFKLIFSVSLNKVVAGNQNKIDENEFVKLIKNDMNKIGIHAENLAIDFFAKLLQDGNNDDKYEETTTVSEETSTTPPDEQIKIDDTTLETQTKSEQFPRVQQVRRRRAIQQEPRRFEGKPPSPEVIQRNQQLEDQRFIQSRNSPVTCRSEAEEKLERTHIEDLKEEVTKLRDLVLVLRDQQKIIQMLQQEPTKTNLVQPRGEPKPNHEELKQIKLDLQNAIESLNQTKQLLALDHLKENRLEIEVLNQKKELQFLKQSILNLSSNRNQTEPILGSPLNLIHFHPLNLNQSTTRESREGSSKKRASTEELSALAKVLDRLTTSDASKSDDSSQIQSKILELEQELKRQKQMEAIGKLLEPKGKSLSLEDDDQITLVQKLQKALSKSREQTELERLQQAIEGLRPKDEFELEEPRIGPAEFQAMLNKVLSGQGSGGGGLTQGQVLDLRKQMMAQVRPQLAPASQFGGDFYGKPLQYLGGSYGPPMGYPSYSKGNYYGFGDIYGSPSYNYQPYGSLGRYPYAPPPPPVNSYQPMESSYQNPEGYSNSRNQFFPAPQSTSYDPKPSTTYNDPGSYAGNPEKYPNYPPANPADGKGYQNQKLGDLKTQIYGLQSVINTMNNRPEYSQNPEDKQTIYNLEQQINELRNIVNNLNQDGRPSAGYSSPNPTGGGYESSAPPVVNYDDKRKTRRKRSVEDNEITEDNIQHIAKYLGSSLGLSEDQDKVEDPNKLARSSYEDLQQRIEALKKQLGHPGIASSFQPKNNDYQAPNYQYNQPIAFFNPPDLKKAKVFDHFTNTVLKIVDKILAATPAVLHRIFGFLFSQLFSGGDGYSYGSGGALQGLFKNMGVFGFLPMFLLKIIDGFTAFMSALKRNKFFKTFLLPVLIIAVIFGSVIFLIWWLQPEESEYGGQYIGYENNGYNKGNNGNNYNSYSRANSYGNFNGQQMEKVYNPMVYSRSYNNV